MDAAEKVKALLRQQDNSLSRPPAELITFTFFWPISGLTVLGDKKQPPRGVCK